jgi:peptidoglycan/LPS O-acetylase OafA/YrhL
MTDSPAAHAAAPDRLAGLDGLRTLAVMMVLLGHGTVLAMGWIGVQIFFVLSGFLITRVLLADRAATSGFGAYLGRFYTRRALRIFPIYYVYLLALTLAVALLPSLAALSGRLLAGYGYVINFYALTAGYFPSRYTDHLWSLAVEEQFYLVWPLLIALVPASRRTAMALAIILAGPLLRLALVAWGGVFSPMLPTAGTCGFCAVYVFPTSHLDAFACGALLNFIAFRPRPWHLAALVAFALACGLAANGLSPSLHFAEPPRLTLGWPLFMPAAWQYLWGYSLINAVSFVLLALVLHHDGVRRAFSARPLSWIGVRSYSVYLLHFPLLAIMLPLLHAFQVRLGDAAGALAFQLPFAAAAIAAAGLSYRFVELPFLNLRNRFRSSGVPSHEAPR